MALTAISKKSTKRTKEKEQLLAQVSLRLMRTTSTARRKKVKTMTIMRTAMVRMAIKTFMQTSVLMPTLLTLLGRYP